MKKVLVVLFSGFLAACSAPEEKAAFDLVPAKKTGIAFSNVLTPSPELNLFKYMYFYNGAGVGAGDFNNDGKIDLFFAANQQSNRLYLNEGDLHFTDVSAEAGIPDDHAWSTGVSVVDINNDGLLDIYVCRVGQYEHLISKNQLLLCTGIKNGIPAYREAAAEWGLDFSGFSTQAAFLDFDKDGDLDMFLLNHSVHHNGTFGERKLFTGTYHPLSGDRFFRNEGNRYTDITRACGINSSAIGYGLGIVVSDINLDGYPDIYIGNDFHENDYLYINQRDGTFRDELNDHIMHTSQFSMGVDAADINNDALPDIISMDMLPDDPYILKRSLGEDEYNLFYSKIGYGYNYQYTRNNLQLNRGNGMFSEVGVFSGIHATDWSWAALWMDFDNDGWKDLFVSNGIPKRMNDMDFVNYISNDEVQAQVRAGNLDERNVALSQTFPEIRLNNRFFRNRGDLKFEDLAGHIAGDKPGFSNGAIYADLDNDGDLDIVTNNINDPVMIYRNQSRETDSSRYLSIQLQGPAGNIHALGATVVCFEKEGQIRTYEKYPVHGFQSSMEIPLHIGMGRFLPDSIKLIWPDGTSQPVDYDSARPVMKIAYQSGLPVFDRTSILPGAGDLPVMHDITSGSGLKYQHKEDDFGEFDREQLLPHKLSTEGPALAIGDINGDHLDDIFVGGAKDSRSAVFLQQASGKFTRTNQPVLDADSIFEDVAASWGDVNKDGFPDLVVASGGNEYYGSSIRQCSRIYVNNGTGKFVRYPSILDSIKLTASAVSLADINGDGYADIFLGGRCMVYNYGKVPDSYLFISDGKGGYREMTASLAPGLSQAGFVKDGHWVDLDKDGDMDLLLALEWGPVTLFENNGGRLSKKIIYPARGWWNSVQEADVDGDGDLDLIAGNAGHNFRLNPTPQQPVRLYVNDFDGNGKKDQILTYYIHGLERPFANKGELERQMPLLKKKFLYAADFARADMTALFGLQKLQEADTLAADEFTSVILINDGHLNYTAVPLPWQAQLSPIYPAVPFDYNNDGRVDWLCFGNYYDNNIQMGRNDGDFGDLLIGRGDGTFGYHNLPGLVIRGQVRRSGIIRLAKGGSALLLAKNNDSLQLVSLPGNIR
ncbi:VCBS repeat-containing protein [Flavihumibacter petaseus]|uniref:ASPIC/UnbV domain-containing protein n=1 Tax=Flavihumibacter petaseus NBRC 106054 TaxID=1220578 RepID=A0A0E9N5T6_9BACT|nr:VCBS repeat-containing protein [Flavihumibacter petaseus]GAO45051.1 hypothetical protein FPE01S_04_02940 [Flavihumibacter petaseus NBRC 106054]